MADLRVTDEIFARYPEVVLGVVTAHGIDNSDSSPDAASTAQREARVAALRHEEHQVRTALAGSAVADHPHIAPWREAYRLFGAKPKDYPSSIENLVRRVLKGAAVPAINPLVDLYNTISLRHLVPVGGEDLDRVEGDIRLTFATGDEPPVRLLGEPEPRPPKPGEVIYTDDLGILCRRWNWKEAERTKLTAATRHAFLVIEGLPPVGPELVERATRELADLVRTSCGGSVGEIAVHLLDRDHPSAPLGPPGS
jgi:DNA/RNA-binding domain of Phe-tRNA-synthetase-like protein